jgi:hypothetical protein
LIARYPVSYDKDPVDPYKRPNGIGPLIDRGTIEGIRQGWSTLLRE